MAHARRTDPLTSHEAAASVKNDFDVKTTILKIYRAGYFCDEDLIISYEALVAQGKAKWSSPSGLRTRRKALERDGLVYDSGQRALTVSGRKSIMWGLTNAGWEAVGYGL